ncbi:Pyridoxal-dependent decarboxylase [Novymonas esmeraldas]|uniref:Pyridoxal-dependent decarboxylase n=1 Tax=Novymonas esmeraldas TaxID=1808958 RepID=A0AAW0F0A2_9TRYP
MERPASDEGHLLIGGVDAVELAATYGTPLMVYDVEDIRARARAFCAAFAAHGVRHRVAYASKALSIRAVYEVALEEGLDVDVVSGGELFTALRAGVPAERIHFHGNNKSDAELRYALSSRVGCFVVDNMREVELLPRLALEVWAAEDQSSAVASARRVRVLLRVAPGITAHTHAHNTTGQVDSKFGLDIASGDATRAFQRLSALPHVHVLGLHCHIGSQIFQPASHAAAARRLMALMDEWDMQECVLNVGGGFGVRYTPADAPLPLQDFVDVIVGAATAYVAERHNSSSGSSTGDGAAGTASTPPPRSSRLRVPEFWIEPGRSLVCEAGTTLYTAGAQKHVPQVRTYLAVDGGMSDNIRPVTYQSVYTAVMANRMHAPADHTYTIVGKLCETGDQLIQNAALPEAHEGDIVAVLCTGAYCYAMASNYNKLCRPAVVFAERGVAKLVVRRETPEDLVRHELAYT